jgi:hypothetical protein
LKSKFLILWGDVVLVVLASGLIILDLKENWDVVCGMIIGSGG